MNAKFIVLVFTVALALFVTRTFADPLPGEVLKFSQLPMINTTIPSDGAIQVFHGHDERSTAYSVRNDAGNIIGYSGDFMADDFADKFSKPVVHVKWWGSYLNRPTSVPDPTVKRFLVSFESDVPAPSSGGGFSHPGAPLLNQIVSLDGDGVLTPGSGTFTERLIPGSTSTDGPIYEYNAELNLGKSFPQKENTVYWLKIVALVETQPNTPVDQRVAWGWHNRDYTIPDPLASTMPAVSPGEHIDGLLPAPLAPIPVWHFQDDAVDGHVNIVLNPQNPIMPIVTQDVRGPQHYLPPFDGPSLIGQFSKDLAFQLYRVPEPASAILLVFGLLICIRNRWQRM
jgi:hypothetical protein